MKLFKYNQFLDGNIINENLDKSKKFMKDMYILRTAITEIGKEDKSEGMPFYKGLKKLFGEANGEKLGRELSTGQKKDITPLDCVELDVEQRKELGAQMRTVTVDENKLRELISTPEFKSIRELKCEVDGKEYQLDRDNIGLLFNFVYFYYAENILMEDLTDTYTRVIQNKDFLTTLEKPFDLNFIDIKIPNNFEKLQDYLNKIPLQRAYKKFESDLPTHLKRDLKEAPKAIKDQFGDMASGFAELSDDLVKGFWGQMMMDDREGSKTKGRIVFRSPISRFKNIRELIENANGYLKSAGNGTFDSFYKKFQDCNLKFQNSGADQIFLDKGIFILEVKSYGANRILNGHTTHCIVTGLGAWNSYVEKDRNGREVAENRQYYIYNFNLPSTNNMWTIGVTIEPDSRTNHIRAAHNKTDGNVSGGLINTLKDWGNEYDINSEATKKAKELGASDSDISKYGPVFCLLRPISSEQLEFRRKSREAEIEITKPGKTKEQIEEYVKKFGANINHQDYSTKLTALDRAVQEDNLEKAKVILSLGGTPNIREDKKTAVINSAKSLDMVKLLVEYQSIITPQCYETISNDIKAVEYLLDNNVDPNFEQSLPVRRSCRGSFDDRTYDKTGDKGESYIETIKLLIERGVKLTDSRGRIMILKWGSEYGRADVLELCDGIGIDHGWIAAYTWANNSMKLNNKDLKEFATFIIPYIEKYEGEQWKVLSNDKKWHLNL